MKQLLSGIGQQRSQYFNPERRKAHVVSLMITLAVFQGRVS